MPVVEPIVATPVALLLQVPPGVASVSDIVWPTQATPTPLIAATVVTVSDATAEQPVPNV